MSLYTTLLRRPLKSKQLPQRPWQVVTFGARLTGPTSCGDRLRLAE